MGIEQYELQLMLEALGVNKDSNSKLDFDNQDDKTVIYVDDKEVLVFEYVLCYGGSNTSKSFKILSNVYRNYENNDNNLIF